MRFSAIDAVSPAIEHTRRQLFQPFRLGQWIKLAFVGMLAGELGSGGCNISNFHIPHQPQVSRQFLEPSWGSFDPALLIPLIVVLLVSGLVLGILFMYISSVMRFVLFDSIMAKECRIGEGWSRRQGPGWRYFLWKLVYLLLMFAGIVVLVGVPAAFAVGMGWLSQPQQHVAPLVLLGIAVFLAVLLFALAIAIIFVLTKDFVVPQMALEGIDAFEGWRRLWRMMRAEKGSYAAYVGVKILMAIGAAIAVGIVALILGLMIAIPTVGLSIIAVLTGKTAGLTWNVYTITLAVVVGTLLLCAFLFVVSLVSVPVIVFFPAYSIYFFAARYPALSVALYPPMAPPPPLANSLPTPG
jgi:hypothetical protein